MIVRNMAHERAKRLWLALGVIANTGALISLKYLSAVVGAIAGTFGHTNPACGHRSCLWQSPSTRFSRSASSSMWHVARLNWRESSAT